MNVDDVGSGEVRKVQVFVSFDVDRDADLYELLLAQSKDLDSPFAVLGCTEASIAPDLESERARLCIRGADHVIVICTEHTGTSTVATSELEIAQQEQTPYLLLWGRRDVMCTRPSGAKPADSIYGWTRQILQEQITLQARNAAAVAAARKPRS